MEPEREAPDNAGSNPDTMKVSNGTNGTNLNLHVSHFSSFSRTSDAFVETDWTSVREPIEDDE